MPPRQRQQPFDRGGLAVEMHRNDRRGARRHRGLDGIGVDQVRVVVGAVDEHRRGARPGNGLGGRDERVGRKDAFVAVPDTERAQRDLDRVSAVRHPDAMRHADELSVFALERGHLRAADERRPGQHFPPALGDLIGHGRMLRHEIDKRNRGHVRAPL